MALMRSVGVRLRLWSREYERDARRAAEATEEIGDAGRRASKDLDGLGDAMHRTERAAKSVAGTLASAFGDSLSMMSRRGRFWLGVGLGITAVSPLIGAAVAGAVTGAVGVGGIAGGIAAAATDPKVKAAAGDFMTTLKAEFFEAGQGFVEPTVEALAILKAAVQEMDLEGLLAPAAEHVETLAEGLAGFTGAFAEGFGEALKNAGPFIEVLADELPHIGDALGDLLVDLSESEGALEGWASLLNLVEGAIRGTGAVLTWLSDQFHRNNEMIRNQPWMILIDAMRGAPPAMGAVIDRTKETSDEMSLLGGELAAAARETDGLLEAFERLNGGMLDSREAVRNAEEAVDELQAALEASNNSLDITTEEGREAEAALDELARSAAEVAQTTYDQTGSVEAANAAYENYIGQLRNILIESGMTAAEVDKLIGRIAAIPTFRAIDFQIRYTTIGQPPRPYGSGFIEGFRHGGVVEHAAMGLSRNAAQIATRPMISWAEPETGGEAYVPKRGNYGRSMSILSEAAGWYGADVVPRGTWGGGGSTAVDVRVSLAPGADGPIGQAIEDRLRFQVTQSGGGSVQQHYGRRGKFG